MILQITQHVRLLPNNLMYLNLQCNTKQPDTVYQTQQGPNIFLIVLRKCFVLKKMTKKSLNLCNVYIAPFHCPNFRMPYCHRYLLGKFCVIYLWNEFTSCCFESVIHQLLIKQNLSPVIILLNILHSVFSHQSLWIGILYFFQTPNLIFKFCLHN